MTDRPTHWDVCASLGKQLFLPDARTSSILYFNPYATFTFL